MKMINEKPLSEIKQEEESKQVQLLSDLYEGMADLFEKVEALEKKVKALEAK